MSEEIKKEVKVYTPEELEKRTLLFNNFIDILVRSYEVDVRKAPFDVYGKTKFKSYAKYVLEKLDVKVQ